MRIGLCAEAVDFALDRIAGRLPGVAVRWDANLGEDEAVDSGVTRIRAHNLIPWPILAIPYPIPWASMDDEAIRIYAGWCGRVTDRHRFSDVEILNEPRILGKWPPEWYRWTAEAVCRTLRADCPETRIWLAGEMLVPDQKGPKPTDWWSKATRGLDPALFDGVCVHPYREPGPPSAARIGGGRWPWCSGSRRAEYDWIRTQAYGKPIVVSEVGWNRARGVTPEQQAGYLLEELDLAKANGVEAVFIYAAASAGPPQDFGIWHAGAEAWEELPAVDAVANWVAEFAAPWAGKGDR